MTKLRTLIADDNEMFQDLITRVLAGIEDIEIVSIVHTGDEAVTAALQHKPDIVIIDLNMPNTGAVRAPKAIKDKLPGTFVFLCSAHSNDTLEVSTQQLGADGYVPKDELKTGLTDMVNKVRERKKKQ